MKLGIIALPKEDSFAAAQRKGLDFLEFCINKGYDTGEFFGDIKAIKDWTRAYGISVGSIGRWKAEKFDERGSLLNEELDLSYRLIDAAAELECPNFICGCNYVEALSYYQNCTQAIGFLSKLLEYGEKKGVKISTYNCRKGNYINNPMAWTVIHGHLKSLGIKYDPAHSRYDGADYLKETAEWGDRFNHIHLKGSLIIDGKRFDDPPAGLDQTDWKSMLSILYAKKYTGGLSIEPHFSVWTGEQQDRGIDFTIRYMRELLL